MLCPCLCMCRRNVVYPTGYSLSLTRPNMDQLFLCVNFFFPLPLTAILFFLHLKCISICHTHARFKRKTMTPLLENLLSLECVCVCVCVTFDLMQNRARGDDRLMGRSWPVCLHCVFTQCIYTLYCSYSALFIQCKYKVSIQCTGKTVCIYNIYSLALYCVSVYTAGLKFAYTQLGS